jgi:hypothetical protein
MTEDRGRRTAEDRENFFKYFTLLNAFKEERGTKNERREKHQLPYIFPLLVWAHAPLV